jgi:ribosomal protein L20
MSDTINDDPFAIDNSDNASIERMATKLAPLRAVDRPASKGPAFTNWIERTNANPAATSGAITYSSVIEGLHRVIARMNEIHGMSEAVRDNFTRVVPKNDDVETLFDETEGRKLPVFDHIAQLTIALSREIERTEKNLALALAALK